MGTFSSVCRPLPPPRPATEKEKAEWFVAADSRRDATRRDVDQIKAYFAMKYPRRWSRMTRDSKWATKKLMKEMGLIEEDAKSFLWWAL